MDKAYYLYIVYAPCGVNVKGFTPTVFRVNFDDKQTMLRWMNIPKNTRIVAALHARKTGADINYEFLQSAIYIDSKMCQQIGRPYGEMTLNVLVCDMFKHWINHMIGFGKFPDV